MKMEDDHIILHPTKNVVVNPPPQTPRRVDALDVEDAIKNDDANAIIVRMDLKQGWSQSCTQDLR
jgi:hypothetical protein